MSRYLSRALLKSVRSTELDSLRSHFPQVLNGGTCDDYYDPDEGSEPDTTGEALQNWEAIRMMNDDLVVESDVAASIEECRSALDEAQDLYTRVHRYGLTLRERSSPAHIDLIREELSEFEGLAEL